MATNKFVIINDVKKLENKVECLAHIDNYWKLLQRVSVGEFITSELIDLNFAGSIGTSKWMLIIYPKGQYNENGIGNGHVSVYLRMLSCDNKDKSLMVKVRVFVKSPHFPVKNEYVRMTSATLLYDDVLKRCIGPFELVRLKELYSSQCQNLFLNGTLTIGCELVVIPLSPRYIKLNEFRSGEYAAHSHRRQKSVMEGQVDSRQSNCRLQEKKPQDRRLWSSILSNKSNSESDIENTPPNDKRNMQFEITKTTKETEDSDGSTSQNVRKLVRFFEGMRM